MRQFSRVLKAFVIVGLLAGFSLAPAAASHEGLITDQEDRIIQKFAVDTIRCAADLIALKTTLIAPPSMAQDCGPLVNQILLAINGFISPHLVGEQFERLTARFSQGPFAATSRLSYSGSVFVVVDGTGQSAGTQFSDAFYIYTDEIGQPREPEHLPNQSLCINGAPVDTFVEVIPPFNPDHRYMFLIDAPGGNLSFGPCDGFTVDNTGAFKISLTS